MSRDDRQRMHRLPIRAARSLAVVGALLCSIVAVGVAGTDVAQATTLIRCSSLVAGGVINNETTFNAAAVKANAGECNWIDVATSISFAARPTSYRDPSNDLRATGIINFLGNSLRISGPSGTVANDRATLTGTSGVGGLVISLSRNVNVEIYDLNFQNFDGLTGSHTGGALAITVSDASAVSIWDTSFQNNTATWGGALLSGGILEISDSEFVGNSSSNNGGAISHQPSDGNGSLTIDNVDFTGNTVSDSGQRGGAIFAAADATINDSSFVENEAPSGGAIFFDSSADAVVTRSNFSENIAAGDGGAVVAMKTLQVEGGVWSQNLAGGRGGAIGARTAEIESATFSSNSSTSEYDGGGAVAVDDSVTVRDTTFDLNTSLLSGGAVSAGDYVVAIRSVFTRNSATRDGSYPEGGAIAAISGSVTLTGGRFADNQSAYGGAVRAATLVDIDGTLFEDNESEYDGGAIYTPGSVVVTDAIFEDNVGLRGGGALRAEVSATVTSSTFRNNEARGTFGGAISAASTTIRRSSFIDNTAFYGGGAIWVSSTVDIANSTFKTILPAGGATEGVAVAIDGSSTATSTIRFSTIVGPLVTTTYGSVISAGSATPLGLVGSVLVSPALVNPTPLCRIEYRSDPLNLTSYSQRSFASDSSCGGSDGATTINTLHTTLDDLGLNDTLSSDAGAGKQVYTLAEDSVLHSSAPLTLLPSGVTTDQLGLDRFASNGLTAAGALRGRTYVAPPPPPAPEVPVTTTVPPPTPSSVPVIPEVTPIVPAVAVRNFVENGRMVISGSSPDHVGRNVRVMVRMRGTKKFVQEAVRIVNKAGRFKWSPSSNDQVEMYFIVGGVASARMSLQRPNNP